MKITKLTFLFIFLILISCKKEIDCSKYHENYIPKNLSESIVYLDCNMGDDFKLKFKTKPESKAISSLHFGLGMSIRNNWRLWDGENEIYNFFKNKEIYHPDDISSIILTSYHRKLNGLDINLQNQINFYKEFHKKAQEEYEKELKEEDDYFESFKIGYYVKIVFTESRNEKGGWINLLGKDYNRESFSNCIAKGYIINKNTIKKEHQKREHFFDIKMEYICEYKAVKFNEGVLKKGDTLNYSITYHNVEKIKTTANKSNRCTSPKKL